MAPSQTLTLGERRPPTPPREKDPGSPASAWTFRTTVASLQHRFPRLLGSSPLGGSTSPRSSAPTVCPSPRPADVAGLRATARRLGVLAPESDGWFEALLRERLRRSLAERGARDWARLYPAPTLDARADLRIADAARRSALSSGLTAAGAHVGEAVTVLTEGLTAPMCVPAVVAAVVGEVVASTKVRIDLVFDLAAIYGVAFDVHDTAELAVIFDLALHVGSSSAVRAGEHPVAGDEMLARLGRGMIQDAMLGLLPFVGIPVSAVSSHRATARVGTVAKRHLRRRAALREALGGAAFRAPPELLLEGAWLLATVDGVTTHEELLVVTAIARAVTRDAPSALARLDASEERRWLGRVAALDAPERAALIEALTVTAGLRGPTRHPERRFLARVGDAAGVTIDLARIEAMHRHLGDEVAPQAS